MVKVKMSFLLLICVSGVSLTAQEFDIQGHRGARGLLPENTISGFLRAIDEGVSTLELDVVVTKDKRVVISHEPYMSPSICLTPEGSRIERNRVERFNIYTMTYDEVSKFDCGTLGNEAFPEQRKLAASKPLLEEMIKEVEAYLIEKKLPKVKYNVEIKSSAKGDGVDHPEVIEFSELVYNVLKSRISIDRFNIQSFDFRVLRHWHQNYPDVVLAALVNNMKGLEQNLEDLGFIPEIYSPNYVLLSKKKIKAIHAKGIKVIPWTVNKPGRMQRLINQGVDGLITDYPNRAKILKY